MSGVVPDAGSFRDPSGFVYEREGRILRQINRSFGSRWDELSASGLLDDLQRKQLLIAHEPASLATAMSAADAHAVIEPERVELISYPYEWTFGELKDAALLTLEAQSVAIAAGYTLRDASAFNVQFRRGKPILIDTLSFQRATPERPWNAYRQFCEHFLAPLALMAYRDVRCGLMLREFIDGIPVDLAAALLPGRTKLNLGIGSHIHAHAAAQRRQSSRGPGRRPDPGRMGALQQAALLDSLRRTVERLHWTPVGTPWAEYADNTSYAADAARSKDDLVRAFLEAASGQVVWDLGANTGRFSAIAASLGKRVIAWDGDPAASEQHYRTVRQTGVASVLPLVVDLTNPSPGLGWAHVERRSFIERASADIVLALALVHHLAVGRNIPLPMIVDLLASLGREVIIEFIPATDAMVKQLLGTREDAFPYPTIDAFRDALGARFEVAREAQIGGSERRLLYAIRR